MAENKVSMNETKITVSGNTGIREGDYIRVSGGSRWKTRMRVTRVGVTTIDVRWSYFEEPWFQIIVIYSLFWSNLMVWSVWYAST